MSTDLLYCSHDLLTDTTGFETVILSERGLNLRCRND